VGDLDSCRRGDPQQVVEDVVVVGDDQRSIVHHDTPGAVLTRWVG